MASERETSRFEDYRRSHDVAGYGEHYARTYKAGYYATLWERIERPLLTRSLAHMAARGVGSALDFACGTGRVTRVLEAHFSRVLGVDVSESMLEVARGQCRAAEIRQTDITKIPLGEKFGMATAFRFFLNAEPQLREAAIDAISRALLPGGWFVTNTHVTPSSPLGVAYRLRNGLTGRVTAKTMDVEELIELGSAHGFEVANVDWYGFMPRCGRLTDGIMLRAMMPIERMFASFQFLPRKFAQAALVTFRAS